MSIFRRYKLKYAMTSRQHTPVLNPRLHGLIWAASTVNSNCTRYNHKWTLQAIFLSTVHPAPVPLPMPSTDQQTFILWLFSLIFRWSRISEVLWLPRQKIVRNRCFLRKSIFLDVKNVCFCWKCIKIIKNDEKLRILRYLLPRSVQNDAEKIWKILNSTKIA